MKGLFSKKEWNLGSTKSCDNRNIKKQLGCVVCSLVVSLLLTGVIFHRMQVVEASTTAVQKELAGEVFRFHVLANSDSERDQAVKLKVRDAVIAYMAEEMPENHETTVETTKRWARQHLQELEKIAKQTLQENGVSYGATAEVVKDYFPEKIYGDVIFPEGEYEALRLRLGDAGGHNWWCVLYPGLCFNDQTCAVVDEEGKEELKGTLTAEEYEMVTATTEFKIKCFFLGDRGKHR